MEAQDRESISRESVERFDPELGDGKIGAAEHQARYRWAAPAAEGKEVLDAGCGVGYGSELIAAAGAAQVVGVDVDPEAVATASDRYRGRGTLEFRPGDLRELDFPDSSFDLVVCFEAIEHIDAQDLALDELRRVLRDDGHLILSSPNRDVYPPGNPHHVREYLPDELESALRERFEAVDLWRQHTWLTSLVTDDAGAGAGLEAEVEASVRKLSPLDPGGELYTLAVAGRAPLPRLRGSAVLCEPIEIRELMLSNIEAHEQLRERTEEVVAARRQIDETVAGYEGSFSWRITKPIRAVKRAVKRPRGR